MKEIKEVIYARQISSRHRQIKLIRSPIKLTLVGISKWYIKTSHFSTRSQKTMTLALAFTINHSKIWTIRHHSTKFKSHRKIHFSLSLLLLKNTTKQMMESQTLEREVIDSFQIVWILKTKKLMKCFWWTHLTTLMMTLSQLINEASSI